MADHAATLADKGHARFCAGLPLLRRIGKQHVERKAVYIVGITQAIRADDGKSAFARGFCDLGLHIMLARFSKACRKHESGTHLALHAFGNRVFHACRRQGENRQVDALGQVQRTGQQFAAVNGFRISAHQINLTLEIIGLQPVENVLPGGAGTRGHADDRDRFGPHDFGDCLGTARQG